MPTAATLISDALGLLGVIDPVEAIDSDDATLGLRVLNRMVDSINAESAMLYSVEYATFTLPAATASRTIGPSAADITLSRPLKVETGGYAVVDGVSYPIDVLTRDEYANVWLKGVSSIAPTGVYYQPSMTNGVLYFTPPVGSSTSITLPFAVKLGSFSATTTNVTLPEGYESYMVHELAMRLSPFYQAPVSPDIRMEAARMKKLIKRLNMQVPEMATDLPLPVGHLAVDPQAFKHL